MILEYVKVLIWPSIVIFLIIKFNQEIKNLLNRIQSADLPGGTRVNLSPPPQYEKLAENNPKTSEIEKIKKDLSYTQIYLDFERIYRFIFGSQIELLKRLRAQETRNGEQSKDTILFFVFTQNIFPLLKNWTFDFYLKFLFDAGLIHSRNDHYLITDKGKAFLSYIEFLNFPNKTL
ncbi:hypothetical protein M1555_03800 [Patescibacteria group bacterium]|nr:hypothetical protein [Patescibacteria group bacterium]